MAKSAHKSIGILGGTFNPVHNGHLYVAECARKTLGLDEVIFVPTYMPPHKKIHGNAKTKDRIKMLRLSLSGKTRFTLSLYEIQKKDRSYSVRTAKFLKKKLGLQSQLFFIIGADSLKDLKKWKDFPELSKFVRFVVIARPGFGMKSAPPGVLKIRVPGKDVSSTEIRRMAKKQKPLKNLVPRAVSTYIKEKGLYGT